jgi:hypothetical protein
MELRKDISKFITQICEKNYSSANSTLETLIEKKLKAKVKKMQKDCCEPCSKKKKVVKENIDQISSSPIENELTNSNGNDVVSDSGDVSQGNPQDISDVPMVPLKNLPRGEYFKRKPDSNKVWIKGEYDKFMKKFLCGAFDDISQGMYLKPTTPVYVEFEF